MYKQKITKEDKEALRRGDLQLLVTLLEASDRQVVRELKKNKEDTRLLQGAALVIDELLKIYKSA